MEEQGSLPNEYGEYKVKNRIKSLIVLGMNKMKKWNLIFTILLIAVGVSAQSNDYELTKFKVSPDELLNWAVMGKGKVEKSGSQVAMQESDDSKGIMLVSPDVYDNDVVVRYKVMALTPATVLVALLSVSDVGDSDKLTVPEDFDGSLGLFTGEKENYFFAFKNGPHNVTPFVRKSPGGKTLGSASKNTMIAGVHYDIEVGKYEGKLWLKVDGEKLFETTDPAPLKGGHIALRIRGTAGFRAGCLIKDLEVLGNTKEQVNGKQPVIGLDNEYINHNRLPKTFQNQKAAYNLVDYLIGK